ncbi:hypothetical protein BC781_1011328 [Sediminitomix flava]|uniref:Uncharacterized protein n=1 Tax=Sediminitomix flava TaxID=379075 RepID=A0A315ZIA3_SEDFL|nr:hypothetical protein BC781_1011328 [Sediminitomix flava]
MQIFSCIFSRSSENIELLNKFLHKNKLFKSFLPKFTGYNNSGSGTLLEIINFIGLYGKYRFSEA